MVDILAHKAFPLSFEQSLEEALRLRPEIKTAQLSIDQAKENVKIARAVSFRRSALRATIIGSSDWWTGMVAAYISDAWTVQALATFTLWNWGNTAFKVGENNVKVKQAEDARTQTIDSVTLEVKDDYLNMQVAEKNIGTAEKSIEQAEENLRMTEERYKYQVSTQTDVVNAVTLLAQARIELLWGFERLQRRQGPIGKSHGKDVSVGKLQTSKGTPRHGDCMSNCLSFTHKIWKFL